MELTVESVERLDPEKIGCLPYQFKCQVLLRYTGELEKIMSGDYVLSITKRKKKRSLTANAYCWVLCESIARAVKSSKEDVYRQAIRQVGVGETLTVSLESMDRFISLWSSKGLGWVVDRISDDGVVATVIAYYGSSTYDTKEMARLIDWLVDEAESLDIDVMTPAERSLLLDNWSPEK